MFTIYFAPLVLNIGSKLVVIDTGNGALAKANTKGSNGLFADNMVAAGFDPKAVDMVVISHFHTDHVNGLLTADGTPAFPNAEVLVPATEWKFWMDDGEMSRAPAGRMAGPVQEQPQHLRGGSEEEGHALTNGARRSRRGCWRSRPSAIRRAIPPTCCRRVRTKSSSSPT